jgi:hypothetical protein
MKERASVSEQDGWTDRQAYGVCWKMGKRKVRVYSVLGQSVSMLPYVLVLHPVNRIYAARWAFGY